MIKVYTPQIQVLLIKMAAQAGHGVDGARPAFTAGHTKTDLTPYLGDGGSVNTVKALASPAGGFSVSFADRFDPQTADTVYALIEPMDVIEIRGAREPQNYPGGTLPLIMRGFVSTIRRVESMGAGGPERSVVIQGQDAGKLWLVNQILFETAIVTDQPYLSAFHLQTVTGIQTRLLGVSDFMTQLVQQVMNRKVSDLNAFSSGQVKPFTVAATVTDGLIMPQAAQGFDQQPAWGLVEQFADRPWNEAFIVDLEEGPQFVFRPVPYKDINGNFLGGAADPGTIDLDISAVVSLDVMRTDARVANFFFVPPGDSELFSGHAVAVGALISGQPLDFDHVNNKPELFGLRKMTAATRLMPNGISDIPTKLSGDERQAAIGNVLTWAQERGLLLRDMNRDNSVLEEVAMTVKGSEELVIGQYLRLTRGDLVSTAYIASVAHNFAPLQTWTTNLTLERGDGFLVRSAAGGRPFYAEGRAGPYS